MTTPLLAIEKLSIEFRLRAPSLFGKAPVLRAVNNVSFTLERGETLALVGESGCGKTTLGRAVVGLYPPTAGSVKLSGKEVFGSAGQEGRAARRRLQMIFQDPYGSLNPRQPVSDAIMEPLEIHGLGTKADRQARARDLIAQVGLPVDALNRYPHQFSGGQRQRIAIARALGPEPDVIVADEPLSALDVSIQSQILNLMADLKEQRGLSYLFISHDLAAVHHIADRVAVMYLGQIVEIGPKEQLFSNPAHPYTRALIDAIPSIGTGKRRRGRTLQGDVPSPLRLPTGCPFHPRCPMAVARCKTDVPVLENAAGGRLHQAACHLKEVQP